MTKVERSRVNRRARARIKKHHIALAKVGIEALIDEATGYQDVRPANALAERLKIHGGDPAKIPGMARALKKKDPEAFGDRPLADNRKGGESCSR